MVIRVLLLFTLALTPGVAQKAPRARDFGRILWSDTRELFSGRNVAPAVMGATAIGAATLFDDSVHEYFGGERVAPVIGSIGNVVGNAVTLGTAAGVMFYTSYRGGNERYKSMSFDLSEVLVLDAIVSSSMKVAVRRDRPDESNHYSFPSGHASGTTAAATVISHYYPKATIPAFLVAGFVGFSRIEKNRHWLSDVVAGHAIGFILGRTVVRGHNPMKMGRFDWAPAVAPGGGIMIDAHINLDSARRSSSKTFANLYHPK